MPSGPNPPWGSSHAGVTMASPALIRVSHSSFWASEPAARITPALMTELTKCGDGASARPSSWYTTMPSSIDSSLPPYCSGKQHAEETELAELVPERVGVADRIVFHRAHDVEAAVARAHAGHRVAQHLLLG